MTTITVSKDGTICLPNHLLQLMGWHAGSELEVMSTDEGVMLKSITSDSSHDSKIAKDNFINQGFGMIKVLSEASPKSNLMDFDVADHIKLFDNMGDE